MSQFTTGWHLRLSDNVTQTMDKVGQSFGKAYSSYRKVQDQLDNSSKQVKTYGSSIDDLNRKLDSLTKARNISVNVGDIKNLNREIERTMNQMERMSRSGSQWGRLKQGISEMPGIGPMVGLATNPYVLGGYAAYKTSKFAYDAAMTRFDYNQQFAKINATAQLDKSGLSRLRNEIMNEGRNSSTPLNQIPGAYEQILSATNDVNLSKSILSASLKGAQAGFSSVGDVSSATVGILNAVGANKTNANQVMDVLFASKRLGVGEFADFSRYLPGNITQGAGLGYDYRDVAGSFSYLTTKGNRADVTSTLLSNLFTSLGRTEVTDKLKKAGVDIYGKDGNRRDLFSVLNDLAKKLEGRTQKGRDALLGDIFTDAQAKQAVNSLLGNTELLGKMIEETRNSAGELNKALESTANEMNTVQQLNNNWEFFKDNVGKLFAPMLNTVLTGANNVMSDINEGTNVRTKTLEEQRDYWAHKVLQNQRTGNYDVTDMAHLRQVHKQMGMSLDDRRMYESQIPTFANISTTAIMNDPSLYGLKYYGRAGTPQYFGYKKSVNPKIKNDDATEKTLTQDPDLSNIQGNISGGGNIKNFTVTISQLKTADQLHIHSASTDEGMKDVEDKIFESLIRVVNSVEASAGGAN